MSEGGGRDRPLTQQKRLSNTKKGARKRFLQRLKTQNCF